MPNLEVDRDNILSQELLKEENFSFTIKEEYLIPDTHPDVQEILLVEANPIVIQTEISNSKGIIDGKIEYNVIYLQREEGSILNSVKYTEKYNNSFNIDFFEHKMECATDCKIEHINAVVINERKIQIETTISANVCIYRNVDFSIVKGMDSSGYVQVLREEQKINRLIEERRIDLNSKSIIRVGMDKPQIEKVISTSARLTKREVKVMEDKIEISCYCNIKILYSSNESKELFKLEDEVYVSKEEELAGVNVDMISYYKLNIDNIDLIIEEDDLGEARIVNTDISIISNVSIFSNDIIELVKDAYSTKFPIELEKEEQKISLIHSIKTLEFTIKDNIHLREGDLRPEEIEVISGNILVDKKTIVDNKINIEGKMQVNVLYKTSEAEKGFSSISEMIPISTILEIPELKDNVKYIVDCYLEQIEGNIEASMISIKASLVVCSKGSYNIERNIITNVIQGEGELDKPKSSIIIYVLDEDETLWNIAKKFNTTIDELIKLNSIQDSDNISKGEKILIPGRALFTN